MTLEQISPKEVKRYFLLADAGKRLFKNPKTFSQLYEEYEKITEEIFNLTDKEVDERIKDEVRLERYNSLNWQRGLISFESVGPYPKLKGLDARLTTGNVLETAEIIEEVKNGSLMLDYDNLEEKTKREEKFQRFVNKSLSFQRNLDFVYENFPVIMLPGNTIRRDYNNWVKAEKLNLPLCNVLDHDLDDGNERAVNYAIAGIESVDCFYSTPKVQA